MKSLKGYIFSFALFIFFFFPVDVNAEGFTLLDSLQTVAHDVVVNGDIAYVASGSEGVKLIDVADPSNIHEVGSFSKENCVFRTVDVENSTLYTTQAYFRCTNDNSLYILDVSDPSTPTLVGDEIRLPTPGSASEIKVVGNYIYMANAQSGLVIKDIRDTNIEYKFRPGAQGEIGYRDIFVREPYVYLADLQGKFWIIDVSNKENIQSVANLPIDGTPLGITVVGNYALIATGSQGMQSINITNKTSPTWESKIITPGYAMDIEVNNGFAFIADEDGLHAVELFGDGEPVQHNYQIDGYAQEVFVSGDYIYVADLVKGLLLFKFEKPPAPDPEVEPFLDLPWDYKSEGLDFENAALAINSYFDHEYPLLSAGINEPNIHKSSITKYNSFNTDEPYSSHDGYDWGTKAKVKFNTPQLATSDGTATFTDDCTPCGNAIFIDHGNGFQTRHYHLRKEGLIVSEEGKEVNVRQGDVIGYTGYSGNVIPAGENGSHIHFMVIEDKNGDGNFEDNVPDGLVDPFGWDSNSPDPWENFIFNYKNLQRTGNKSHYLWIYNLSNRKVDVLPEGGAYDLKHFKVSFPNGVDEQITLNLKTGGNVVVDKLESIGHIFISTAHDVNGNLVSKFGRNYQIVFDFNDLDTEAYDLSTLAIYSSEGGSAWQKENTIVDLERRSARVDIDHMSEFALMAEKKDQEPPNTEIEITGEEGEESWFRSDVTINFNPSDDNDIEYTLFKINDDDWQKYTSSIHLFNEGLYEISYMSRDVYGNEEDTKSTTVHIDKTFPEFQISFNPDSKETNVEAIDSNSVNLETIKIKGTLNKVVAVDQAGNKTTANTKIRKYWNSSTFSLKSLKYGDHEYLYKKNVFYTSYWEVNDYMKQLTQSWFRKDGISTVINYSGYHNQSKILTFEPYKKYSKKIVDGLKILSLRSDNGNLVVEY